MTDVEEKDTKIESIKICRSGQFPPKILDRNNRKTPLNLLFNKSLQEGKIPDSWRVATQQTHNVVTTSLQRQRHDVAVTL